jgi:hypothetical protein
MSAAVLRTPDAAKYLGVSASFLAKLRVYGGPDAIPFVRLSSRGIGYLVSDLNAHLEARRCRSTSDRVHAANA